MKRAWKQRPRASVGWPLSAWLRLLLPLLVVAGLGLHDWYASFYRPTPGDLHLYSGVIESARYRRSRRKKVPNIEFRVEGAEPTFVYVDFYPSFGLAKRCLVRGASVTVGVAPPLSTPWQLSCRGMVVSDINSMARSQLASGRDSLHVAIGFGLGGMFCIWRLFSGWLTLKKARRKS
jgi:hypothetical protein